MLSATTGVVGPATFVGTSYVWSMTSGWRPRRPLLQWPAVDAIGTDGGGEDLQVGDINGDGPVDVVVNGSDKITWYENPRGRGRSAQSPWTLREVDVQPSPMTLPWQI